MSRRTDVVVLGAVYGGLKTVLDLTRNKSSPPHLHVTLIDKNSYHQYAHLFHEVSARFRPREQSLVSLSWLLHGRDVEFVQGNVKKIDPSSKVVTTNQGEIECDIIVVALGSKTTYYGIDGLKKHPPSLKSVDDAVRVREKITAVLNGESLK